MHTKQLHPWSVTPKEAIRIQEALRQMVITSGSLTIEQISNIAACDVSYSKRTNKVYAVVAVFSCPQLEIIEEGHAVCKASFPYVPGLLVFREGPALLQVFSQLASEPDVIMFDGHGMAHPREIGIASHMGIILDKPSIGVAKTVLCGQYKEPSRKKGASSPLIRESREIGKVLRTRNGIKPIFVSIGHRIDLPSAEKLALTCCKKYRLPEPIRQAHLLCSKLRASRQ